MGCPKCSKFKKSGRVSCCAPGGAWYDNCGVAGNANVRHSWFDGVDSCKPTTKHMSPVCPTCGIMKKSGRLSCCGRGGSWFGNCGSAGSGKLYHTWYEGVHPCKTLAHSKAAIGRQANAAQQQLS